MDEVDGEIAVIGIGCSFPGGEGIDNFWKVLTEGKNCAVEIPADRFDTSDWYDPDGNKPGKTYTTKAAFIDGFNELDQKLFGVTDAESNKMDPQHKLLLHCTYRAFENAGIPLEKANGTKTGVFLGLMNKDYEMYSVKRDVKKQDIWLGTGIAMSIAANRISYAFNLTGPSVAVDCACSSSLVALHFGCQAIKQGDCEMALCCGVNCIIEPVVFVFLSNAKMISPDGMSKPFSKKANGYGRGEGCGVVLLKPLKKALADSDHIWGIISKTGVNQDGRTVSPITKPSMVQQEELLRHLYCTESDVAGVQYIEAHGTGTPAGDPVEATSISNVIAKARPAQAGSLTIGSVKSNIGHTESAAGVAGLIKVLLMMKHETIVPSVFYSEDSSSVDVKALNITIPTKTKKWETTGRAGRVAGVNNFGFGGTNAHAIVKQYRENCAPKTEGRKCNLYFVLSAASEKSLSMMIADTIEKLDTETDLDIQSLAYTSACRRSHLKNEYRKAFQTSTLDELKKQLSSAKGAKIEPSKLNPRLVFVFCGNGLAYQGMCGQLLRKEHVFREKVREIESLFRCHKEISMIDMLENGPESSDQFSDPEIVQPLLFAIQVALFTLLKNWGITPDAVLGHSVGEVASAHCSGLLSLEDAVKVIYHRSLLQGRVTGGKMLVVSNIDVSKVVKALTPYSKTVCLAAYNSPQSCTLSGDAVSIDKVHNMLKSLNNGRDLFLHVLDVPAAYHSHMMDPILSEVKDSIGLLKENEMVTELYSTVTGKIATHDDFSTGTYWAQNIREPVAFEQAVRAAAKVMKNVVFVEIGPKRALQRNIIETLGRDVTVLPSVQPEKDHETVLTLVSKLFEKGFQVDWSQLYRGCETKPATLPRYHFDSVKKSLDLELRLPGSTGCHPVLTQTSRNGTEFTCNLIANDLFYLLEHKNNGVPIIPGAFYAELGLAACMASAKPRVPLNTLRLNISFQKTFVYSQNSPEMKVMLEPAEDEIKFQIVSKAATFASGTVKHRTQGLTEHPRISLESVYKRCTSVMSPDEHYSNMRLGGFQYESVFRNESDVHYGEELREIIAKVSVPEALLPQLHDYCIHPIVMDYFMQLLPATVANVFLLRPGFPAAIDGLTVVEPLQPQMVVYLRATEVETDQLKVSGYFTDKDGKVLIEIKQVVLKYLRTSYLVEQYFYHADYSDVSGEQKSSHLPKALVFADQLGLAEALKKHLAKTSKYISFNNAEELLSQGFQKLLSGLNITNMKKDFQEVLLIWSNTNFSSSKPDKILESMVNSCEVFRQLVMSLRFIGSQKSIRTITYRASELTVDQVNSGFVLTGMTRGCAAEASGLLFQLVDINSVSTEDVSALAQVITSYPCSTYPELVVRNGRILKPNTVRTPLANRTSSKKSTKSTIQMSKSENFTLKTADPYKITRISAIPMDELTTPVQEHNVHVELSKVCVHSSDYYPVSVPCLKHGQTIYWNSYTTQDHKLLALDFSGRVTAVGKNVKNLKVGDHIVSCYPTTASSKIEIPEHVCYKTKKFPFLMDVPCLSFLVLSWEILDGLCRLKKEHGKLGIFSSEPDSGLVNVLILTANKSGWNVVVGTELTDHLQAAPKFDACVLLPPFDKNRFSQAYRAVSVKHIIAVCEDHQSFSFCDEILREENSNACVQTIQVSRVLERGQLKLRRPQIYKWLKSLHLDKKALDLPTVTFQKVTSGSIDMMHVEKSESHFCSKAIRVITLRDADPEKQSEVPLLLEEKQFFEKNSVYIVTGGLTGLGFETVKFIAKRGGGYVVILSRSSPSEKMKQEISAMKNLYFCTVVSMACDVSDQVQVQNVISAIEKRFPSCPIKGIFHSAVVLHDGLLETMNKSLYEKVLKPKINGAVNLHHATKHCKLDYFVCYSSISSYIGNMAQSNYAAANSFLDIFCHYRRNLGLAGQSINWGALNLGLLLNKEHFQKFLEQMGMVTMDVNEIHQSLEECLRLNRSQQVICKFNFKNMATHVLSQNTALKARFKSLVEDSLKYDKLLVSELEVKRSTSSPIEYVKSVLGNTLPVKDDDLNEDTTLTALGIDSMLAMTLQNQFAQERGLTIPLVKFLDPNTTLGMLVAILTEASNIESDQTDGTVDYNIQNEESTSL